MPNLFIVASGPEPPNPAELIGSDRMTMAMRVLIENFDYVVFDTPPALEITDASVLARVVDGSVLVARAATTPRDAVARTAELLERVGGNLLGALLNDVDSKAGGYGYGYGYGYGSAKAYGKYFGES